MSDGAGQDVIDGFKDDIFDDAAREAFAAIPNQYQRALLLHEELDPVRNRHVMVARIGDEVPPLYDAKVVKISVDFMVITGFERIQRDIVSQTVEYAQSWFLEHDTS